jgi:anaerobic ribonucleoside-triphosphate reductase
MENCTLQEKIKLGSILDIKCGGGQISHINLQGRFNNEEQAWEMLNYIAKSGVIYSAYNIQISVCKDGHGFSTILEGMVAL